LQQWSNATLPAPIRTYSMRHTGPLFTFLYLPSTGNNPLSQTPRPKLPGLTINLTEHLWQYIPSILSTELGCSNPSKSVTHKEHKYEGKKTSLKKTSFVIFNIEIFVVHKSRGNME
jgi:hypothetical protein